MIPEKKSTGREIGFRKQQVEIPIRGIFHREKGSSERSTTALRGRRCQPSSGEKEGDEHGTVLCHYRKKRRTYDQIRNRGGKEKVLLKAKVEKPWIKQLSNRKTGLAIL